MAVPAVAWSHWERPYQFGIPFGAGVHLFYVLSGFLITGILLDVRERADRVAGLKAFYIRRALRIFPAFYLTLALAWIADVPPVRETFWWHALYLSNVQIVVSGEWPGAISHFWSLAVEEQFYLLWPWLIVWVPRRWLVPAIVAAIAVAPLFRLWLAMIGYRETMLGVLTPGWLDSLGVGALLALMRELLTRCGDRRRAPRRHSRSTFRLVVSLATVSWVAMLIVEAAGIVLPLPLLAIKQTLQAVGVRLDCRQGRCRLPRAGRARVVGRARRLHRPDQLRRVPRARICRCDARDRRPVEPDTRRNRCASSCFRA